MESNENHDDRTQSFNALSSGTQVLHYRIIDKIGTGGMGEVYLAEDIPLHRNVALKFLPTHYCLDENSRKRFKREAQAAAKLSHPNIVKIYEVGDFKSQPFFAMELVSGKPLRNILKEKAIPLHKGIDYCIQICEALCDAHLSGVIHRDIKPSNIIIDSHDNAILLDFGLAAVKGTSHVTKDGTKLGTMGYMAPEIATGKEADNRSDIFSLGVTLYELVTGLQPFIRDSDAATLHATVYDTPVPAIELFEDIPVELNNIINTAQEKDPDNRYQTIEDMLTDLKELRVAIGSVEIISKRLSFSKKGKNRLRLRILVISVLMLISFLIYLIPDYRHKFSELFGKKSLRDQIHLAVLPFNDLSENGSEQTFCIGLADFLSSKITQLESYHESLFVIPASEVRKQAITSAREAYDVFGANLAVSGSMLVVDENIRVTMNLIDTKSVRQLQSEFIDMPKTDLVTFQDTTIDIILNMLKLHLNESDKKKIYSDLTNDSRAYELLIKGQGFLFNSELINTIDSAILYFREVLKIDSINVPAMTGLSKACWEKFSLNTNEMYKELSLYYLNRAGEISDQDASVYLTSGYILNEMGQSEQAADEFASAIKYDSLSRMAYKGLANSLVAMNNLDSAETVFKKAIAVKPDYWAGYISLSWFYLDHGRYDDALDQLEILEMLKPDGYDILNDLGAIYHLLGKNEKAEESWQKSIEIKANYGALSNLATIHYFNKDYQDAVKYYRKALDLNFYDHRLWFNYASALKNLGAGEEHVRNPYNKGIQLAEKKLEINPNNIRLLSELADAYSSINEYEKAIPLIEKALSLDPENIDTKITAGLIFETSGNRVRAIEEIAYVLNKDYPKNQLEPIPGLSALLKDTALNRLLE